MKHPEVSFEDNILDEFLMKWLEGRLSPAEQKEWNRYLMFQTDFRENFSEWIKSLREAPVPESSWTEPS